MKKHIVFLCFVLVESNLIPSGKDFLKANSIKHHSDIHAQPLRVGRNAEGNSSSGKFAESTNQAGDNEAAQEQVEVGEV